MKIIHTQEEMTENLRRKDTDWNPDNFGVCDLQFQKDDFLPGNAPCTNTERVRLRLRTQSVPTIFPNYPNWFDHLNILSNQRFVLQQAPQTQNSKRTLN